MESLAVRWLFPSQEVRIDTRCLDCAEPIAIRFRDDSILEISPSSTVGHVQFPLKEWRSIPMPYN